MVFFMYFHKQLILPLVAKRDGRACGFGPARDEGHGATAATPPAPPPAPPPPPPDAEFALLFLSDRLL